MCFRTRARESQGPWREAKPSCLHRQLKDATPGIHVAEEGRLQSETQANKTVGLWPRPHEAHQPRRDSSTQKAEQSVGL